MYSKSLSCVYSVLNVLFGTESFENILTNIINKFKLELFVNQLYYVLKIHNELISLKNNSNQYISIENILIKNPNRSFDKNL